MNEALLTPRDLPGEMTRLNKRSQRVCGLMNGEYINTGHGYRPDITSVPPPEFISGHVSLHTVTGEYYENYGYLWFRTWQQFYG